MGRKKMYATAAGRQQAYRDRRAAQEPILPPPPAKTKQKPRSRPARLAAALLAVEELRDEYETWLDAMPESLLDSNQAVALTEAIDQLTSAAEILTDLRSPRGFGRD